MVLALLAVVLQVSDVVIVAVGVVPAALAPDQPFDVSRCLTRLNLGLRCFHLLHLALAPPLHLVAHHLLAEAVRAQVVHELLLVLRLEVTRFAAEQLLLLRPVCGGRGHNCTTAALLRCVRAGGGAGLRGVWVTFGCVFFIVILVVSADNGLDGRVRRLWILNDANFPVVLVIVAVPVQTLR